MTKKVPKQILRIERNFFVNLRKTFFWPPTPRCRRRRFFGTGGAPPPPHKKIPVCPRPRKYPGAQLYPVGHRPWMGGELRLNVYCNCKSDDTPHKQNKQTIDNASRT